VAAAAAFEPNVPWNADFLRARYRCLRAMEDPRASTAEKDWYEFTSAGKTDFAAGLMP
jgi:hypothetical protein